MLSLSCNTCIDLGRTPKAHNSCTFSLSLSLLTSKHEWQLKVAICIISHGHIPACPFVFAPVCVIQSYSSCSFSYYTHLVLQSIEAPKNSPSIGSICKGFGHQLGSLRQSNFWQHRQLQLGHGAVSDWSKMAGPKKVDRNVLRRGKLVGWKSMTWF